MKAYADHHQPHTPVLGTCLSVLVFRAFYDRYFLEFVHSSKGNFSQAKPVFSLTSIVNLGILKNLDDLVFWRPVNGTANASSLDLEGSLNPSSISFLPLQSLPNPLSSKCLSSQRP